MRKIDEKVFEPLDEYEKELMEHLEQEDISLQIPSQRKSELEELAKKTLNDLEEKKRISINVRAKDLKLLKQKAKSSSIPYQNLIQALINNYVQGKIKLEI